jgi:crossover junction endodeoxyribonuclease RuvC
MGLKSVIRILGIDPGSLKTGFAVLELTNDSMKHLNHGVIKLEVEATLGQRLRDLSESLAGLLSKYQPDQVVIEKIFLGKSADSAFKLGHARGVAMSESAKCGAEIFEYATREVKKAVAGTGAATKEEVQLALKRQLRLSGIVNLDGSDALALTVCHAQKVWTEVAIRGQILGLREKNL